ncbi:MAG: hypothetical protein R2751_08065 [Bacteroidales bacterium]
MRENNKLSKLDIEEIKKILSTWNPLGTRRKEIVDLNDYETEANDIAFHIITGIHFPFKRNPIERSQTIVRDVLNEAFDLSLSKEECKKPAIEIMEIISK